MNCSVRCNDEMTVKPKQMKERNKMKITAICATLLLATSLWASSEAPVQTKSSPEFERMKTLVGTWTGKADIGQGPVDLTVNYRLLAGGTVLEERVFAGTPNEM